MPKSTTGSGAGAGSRRGSRSSKARGGFEPIEIAVRVKPLDAERKESGMGCDKRVSAWDTKRNTVTMSGTPQGTTDFNYACAVMPPECHQEDVYSSVLEKHIKAFVEGYDVNFLCFGQTGSGKTHTMFGPPGSMEEAAKRARSSDAPGDILADDCGIFLRGAFDAFKLVKESDESGATVSVLTGSMLELLGGIGDLLNNRAKCHLDDDHRVRGAVAMPLESYRDIANLASAVETRSTRATLMNDVSSRSHCVTILTLTQLHKESDTVRVSTFSLFDMMGSERFKGQNSAHDVRQNNKKTMAGLEGIFANMSLAHLAFCVQQAYRNNKKRGSAASGHVDYRFTRLTRMLHSSLVGHSRTAMVVTLSLMPRNGDESYHSLVYGRDLARLTNIPRKQPSRNFTKLYATATAELASSQVALRKLLSKGNNSKYLTIRRNQVTAWSELLEVLERIREGTEDKK